MGKRAHTATEGKRTFLGRLARDIRGNTLAIMAAALVPLAGMVGGGIDISRMYITKTRLQHACDAGALAGRKQMGGGSWTTTSQAVADQFFAANYATGAYGSTNLTHAYTESGGKVVGTASAVLPMTLMRVLGKTTETLAVTCNADMKLPNTDIMFVLDNTGSMACDPDGTNCTSSSTSKIAGLKVAVKCFYEIVAKLDTDATCATGTPSGGTGSQVQIRFGFMPYTTNVNVGKLLSPTWFANSRSYQTRRANWWIPQGSPQVTTTNMSDPKKSCGAGTVANSTAYSNNNNTMTTTVTSDTTATVSGGTCDYTRTVTTTTYNKSTTWSTGAVFADWYYASLPIDVSLLKNGSGWNSSFQWPIGPNGANKTISWDGCIEERQTVSASSYWPIPSGANDLNIDMVPNPSDSTTLWGPALQQVIYDRNIVNSYSQAVTSNTTTTTDYYNGLQYYCPTEAKKLQTWPDPTAFDTYVDSLQPSGNTYHDIGMLWGARFMSPTGIFASENALTPAGGQIDRHMIFMTDGYANSAPCDYTAYGVLWYDQRTTTDVGPASGCGAERTQLDDQVNARLDALCTAVKNKNITLWVISFGSGSNTATDTRLANCASSGRFFKATDSASLQQTFASIANQISQLRLTQ